MAATHQVGLVWALVGFREDNLHSIDRRDGKTKYQDSEGEERNLGKLPEDCLPPGVVVLLPACRIHNDLFVMVFGPVLL